MNDPRPHPLLAELKVGLGPSPQQAELLAARLAKTMGTPLAPPLVPAAGTVAGAAVATTKTALGVKVLLGLLVASAAGYGVVEASRTRVATDVPAVVVSQDAPPPLVTGTPSLPPLAAPEPSVIAETSPVPLPRVPSAHVVHPVAPPAPAASAAEPEAALADTRRAEERALIDEARRALLGGNGGGALASLAQHRQRFAHGTLREEREALTVQALAASGVAAQARAARTQFETTWPRSLFLPAVRNAAP